MRLKRHQILAKNCSLGDFRHSYITALSEYFLTGLNQHAVIAVFAAIIYGGIGYLIGYLYKKITFSFNNIIKSIDVNNKKDDLSIYEKISDELNYNRNDGLWLKCYTEAKGDEKKALSAYVDFRYRELTESVVDQEPADVEDDHCQDSYVEIVPLSIRIRDKIIDTIKLFFSAVVIFALFLLFMWFIFDFFEVGKI